MSRIRDSFVDTFGEEEAKRVEEAAKVHLDEVNPYDVLGTAHKKNRGHDPFQWAIVMVIAYNCIKNPGYREWHGFKIGWDEFDEWVKLEADLTSYEGEFDAMALMLGEFTPYLEVGQ